MDGSSFRGAGTVRAGVGVTGPASQPGDRALLGAADVAPHAGEQLAAQVVGVDLGLLGRAPRAPLRAAHSAGSTSASSVPATASRRIRSPSRSRASGPPASASGLTWMAAGTLPLAPLMRPSVTSATLKPLPCSTASGGVSLCSSGMPLACGPWKRTTATTSRSSSPALKAVQRFLAGEDPRRGLDHVAVVGHGRGLDHGAAQIALQQLQAAGGRERLRPGAARGVAAVCGQRLPAQAPPSCIEGSSVCAPCRAGPPWPRRVQAAAVQQFAQHEARAAGGLELVHVGAAVGVDARQQRHRGREVGKVRPVDDDARRARHRHPVDQVVGAAAGGQQRDHRVDDAAFVHQAADGREAPAARGDRQHLAHGLARERLAQPSCGCTKAAPGTCRPIASSSIWLLLAVP
jgi:hypothetical protein